MCPYCDSKNKAVKFVPVSSRQFFYDAARDLAFHKPCGNHLAVRIGKVHGKTGTFSIYDHHVLNPFTTFDNFEVEQANAKSFFETLKELGGGTNFVMERTRIIKSRLERWKNVQVENNGLSRISTYWRSAKMERSTQNMRRAILREPCWIFRGNSLLRVDNLFVALWGTLRPSDEILDW